MYGQIGDYWGIRRSDGRIKRRIVYTLTLVGLNLLFTWEVTESLIVQKCSSDNLAIHCAPPINRSYLYIYVYIFTYTYAISRHDEFLAHSSRHKSASFIHGP